MTLANPVNPSIRKWTRDEYHQMAELGFFEGQRVQLIEGEIIEMAPQKDDHAGVVSLAHRALLKIFGNGYWVRMQLPLQLLDLSEPEPDVSVVKGDERNFMRGAGHPRTALLVVEVSDTTLRFDQKTKASVYATAGIEDYWIINLIDRQIEVYRKPVMVASGASTYADVSRHTSGQSVTPLAAPGSAIAVIDVLP